MMPQDWKGKVSPVKIALLVPQPMIGKRSSPMGMRHHCYPSPPISSLSLSLQVFLKSRVHLPNVMEDAQPISQFPQFEWLREDSSTLSDLLKVKIQLMPAAMLAGSMSIELECTVRLLHLWSSFLANLSPGTR
jgi:hypothetical protein